MHLVVLYKIFSGHTFQIFTENKGIIWLLEGIYKLFFYLRLRSAICGHENDTTRSSNKQYVRQKSLYHYVIIINIQGQIN